MSMSNFSFGNVGLAIDIIPEKGGNCSFYLQTPIDQGFSNKKSVVFDTTVSLVTVMSL